MCLNASYANLLMVKEMDLHEGFEFVHIKIECQRNRNQRTLLIVYKNFDALRIHMIRLTKAHILLAQFEPSIVKCWALSLKTAIATSRVELKKGPSPLHYDQTQLLGVRFPQ